MIALGSLGYARLSCSILIIAVTSLFVPCRAQSQMPPITDIVFDPGGASIIACSQDGLRVYSWPDLKLVRTVDVSFANLHCLKFSPDGRRLAVGGGYPSEEGIVEIFAWPECTSMMKLAGHQDSVFAVVWCDNTGVVTGSLDRLLIQWDLVTKQVVRKFKGHSRGITAACFLQNGEMVTAAHDQSVRVWDVETGKLVRSLNQHSKPIHSMANCPVSGDMPMVATAAGDRTIRFWQPTIGRMVRYIRLDSEPLDIAWVSETMMIASCVDGKARLVDSRSVRVVETIPGVDGWGYAVAVHPRDRSIAVAGGDGTVRRVDVQPSADAE